LDGLNVTIPYKETMTVWLDDLTPAARQIGAVNTLFFSDGRLIGDNTDALGFIQDLQVCFGTGFLEKAGTALVLGAGGAARAVVYGLREAGWAVVIAARRPAQAQKMVRDLGGEDGCLEAVELARDEISRIQPDLVVNATPLGMWPAAAVSPWPEGLPFPEGARFYDLIYNPPETKLMGLVRRQGGQVAGGAGMLASQAVLSFRRWTGVTPRLAAMRAVLERALLTDDDAEVLDE
jgi:shikimate dehydrogenase